VFASGKPHHPIAKEALNVGQRICALCGTAADYKNVDATSSIQLDVATQNYKTHATHSNVALMLQHNTCDTFEHCIDVATHATHATHLNVALMMQHSTCNTCNTFGRCIDVETHATNATHTTQSDVALMLQHMQHIQHSRTLH
jgi:hypothetical protein